MALTRLLSVLALVIIAVERILGELTNLGDPFKFKTNATCAGGEMMMLIHLLETHSTDGSSQHVAKLVDLVWTADPVYAGRITHDSPSSLILKSAQYNDRGLYEFTCDSKDIDRIQLSVVIPSDVSVAEGQSVKLPCFFFTAGESIKRIRWTLNGKLVLEQERSTGQITHGPNFQRASVSPEWHLTGNLSMNLERVQSEDQGEFICHIIHEDNRTSSGTPGVVRLKVKSSAPLITCSTPGPPEDRATGAGAIVSIFLNVVLSIAAATFLILWLRSCRPSTEVTNKEREMTGVTETVVL